MSSPRACPDPWTAIEDHYCDLAAAHHVSPLSFAGRLVVASTILAAGGVGAVVTWLVLRVTGWLPANGSTR